MGCGASSGYVSGDIGPRQDPYVVKVNETWTMAMETLVVKKGKHNTQQLVVRRTGWKTIRIFVSSTFRDFHFERELLVKKVFPDLRAWCESRRLQLIECDLRWGVPKDYTTEGTLRACLEEIDRCYQDNIMPFFINMTSERIGWIPNQEEIPDAIKEHYRWVEGLSMTEMEIMHGAYRTDNPNALFLLRDPSFLETVPEEHRERFVDNQDIAPYKLEALKKQIKDRFPGNRMKCYKVHFTGFNETTKTVELGGVEDEIVKPVYEFFKSRIEAQYPLPQGDPDPYVQMFEQHDSFMNNKAEAVLGRDDVIKQISDYIGGVGNDVPFLLLGDAGSGKSSIMAKVAEQAVKKAGSGQIPGGGDKGWHVFYHFVGAVPGSTELELMLKRMLKEIDAVTNETMPINLDTAAQESTGALNNPRTRPVILIVDALNQFDNEKAAELVTWVPRKLAPHVRCVFSMIPETPPHKALMGREPAPKALQLKALDHNSQENIVETMLGRYNKHLDAEQMQSLLSKTSAQNPLWLSIACEELRVFGQFRMVSDKINHMADGLLELEMQVLSRFENENGGNLLVAALCLLEVSQRGLLEMELLEILGDEERIMPQELDNGGAEKDDNRTEKSKKEIEKLPAFKWSEVYRALKPFLRPFGDSGEGRLDFYHRSLSKAVRKKYFQTASGDDKPEVYNWWHSKLADYFMDCSNLSRKLEEYPYHLIFIKDESRLVKFLTDWEVFDFLFDIEFSSKLIKLWRTGCDFDAMEEGYLTQVENMKNSGNVDKDTICHRLENMARFFAQSGRYNKAYNLLDEAVELEEKQLGARKERMVEMYYVSALVRDEEMKQEEYMYRSQLPNLLKIIELYKKTAEILKTLDTPMHKRKLGITKNRLAFYYSGYNLRGGDDKISEGEAKEKAVEAIDEAIEIFEELKDQLKIGDCYTTKGVVIGHACSEQLKYYKQAEDILMSLVGLVHITMDRLCLNMAITYEEMADYSTAYSYFRRWYDISMDLYGKEHPKTLRPIKTLSEPLYRRIAAEKGDAVPEYPSP